MSESEIERESMEYDVVIVGAGPSGLSAAIRIKQLAQEAGADISVAVLEKGAEVGAHILSGAVIDPHALDELFPKWRDMDAPLKTEVKTDKFLFLGPAGALRFPNFLFPPLMSNHGMYIASLGNICRWLNDQAEALGVEVYPGIAVSDVVLNDDGSVKGVVTGDLGIAKDGSQKGGYTPGMELHGKYTLIGEGARGSVAKKLIEKFELSKGRDPQKFGLGMKELWEIDPAKHQPGLVVHTMGWPLSEGTGGGSFMYHFEENLVSVGFVVHLNYKNPYISPFDELQRHKHHPALAQYLEGGKRISYGARAITEGGLQSIPKLAFPGGALIGCSAGFVNLPRIKGTHNAMKTGMLAAESVVEALQAGRAHDELISYEPAVNASWVHKDLHRIRNVKPLWTKFGNILGLALGGIDMWTNYLLGFSFFGTMHHDKPDHASLKKAADCKAIDYPKPDGKLSFDKLSSVFLSNTNHEEDQPVHLVLNDASIPIDHNLPDFDEPAQRYCPAGVYEVVRDDDGSNPKFVINAQNCVHCKTCDIKDPTQNINWTVPEGGGGPVYPNM